MSVKRRQIYQVTLHLWQHLTAGVDPRPCRYFLDPMGNYTPTVLVFERAPTREDLVSVYDQTGWMQTDRDFPVFINVPTMPDACKRTEMVLLSQGRVVGRVELEFFHIWSPA